MNVQKNKQNALHKACGKCALCIAVVFLSACSTIPRGLKQSDIYSVSAKKDNRMLVEFIERSIINQYREFNSEKNTLIKKELDSLLSVPSSDAEYLARIYALYADWYILNRDRISSKKMLKTAENYDSYDEYVRLVNSRLITKNEEKRQYLEDAVKQNPDFYRLTAELGSVYYELQNYTNALAAFDAAFDFLPEEYGSLYAEKRTYCAKFYTVDKNLKKETAQIISQNVLLLTDMAALAQDNTNALDFITGTARRQSTRLAERLKADGWYAPDANLTQDTAKRKDAALFLWHLIAENNSALLNRYSEKYKKRNAASPVQDVSVDDMYFDAVLGTVEEDVIPLIEGKRFEPDGAVSGLEFYNWLKKADTVR